MGFVIRPFSSNGEIMDNINLGKRLSLAAEFVRKGSRLCDIGTDHAYLPAYLVKNGISVSAIAADLRKGPLKNAEKTVEDVGLKDKITLRLSDGLDEISPDEVSDIVLAGMGGDLICDILKRADWIHESSKRIIAQPQTHSEKVRAFFISNGFEIIGENACEEDGRLYICICAEYTGENKTYLFGYEYYGELVNCESVHAKEYLIKQKDRFMKRADGLSKSGQNKSEAEFLYKLCDTLNKLIKEKT